MSEKSTHIREYAAKLDLQEAQANDFKEKMLRFAMDWQSFSQVSAFFPFCALFFRVGLTHTACATDAGRLSRHGGRGGSGRLGGVKGEACKGSPSLSCSCFMSTMLFKQAFCCLGEAKRSAGMNLRSKEPVLNRPCSLQVNARRTGSRGMRSQALALLLLLPLLLL